MSNLLGSFSLEALIAFCQVILIDITLAGDNAVVIGLVVKSLSPADRKKAIFAGIGIAAILRIILALVAARLLEIIGLTLAGGILLLWVCWRMYREMCATQHTADDVETGASGHFGKVIFRIFLADLSMSLDNILAVAGAASKHPYILVVGLVFSVMLMGVAASFVARLLDRYKWLTWFGLLIVLFVALELIYKGSVEVWPHIPFLTK